MKHIFSMFVVFGLLMSCALIEANATDRTLLPGSICKTKTGDYAGYTTVQNNYLENTYRNTAISVSCPLTRMDNTDMAAMYVNVRDAEYVRLISKSQVGTGGFTLTKYPSMGDAAVSWGNAEIPYCHDAHTFGIEASIYRGGRVYRIVYQEED